MPATEKTWRDQMRMHVIFGVSALVMLVGTVWMLAKDHNREWRQAGLSDRAKERWTAAAQLAEETSLTQLRLAELQRNLQAATAAKVPQATTDRFQRLVAAEDDRLAIARVEFDPADFGAMNATAAALTNVVDGSEAAVDARLDLKAALDSIVREAKRRENALTVKRKFTAADQTAITSLRGIAIGESQPAAEIEKTEQQIDELAEEIADLDVRVASAKSYRLDLEGVVRQIEATETELWKEIGTIESDLARLSENVDANSSGIGEWVNRWPVLDAIYNGNIKLEQIWLPDITINYNFSHVSRYDRCVNCHKAIDKIAPGSASEPAYPTIAEHERTRIIELATPDSAPAAGEGDQPPTLESAYGFRLAAHGQIDYYAVTVQFVLPESAASLAGLRSGDVIQKISGGDIYSADEVNEYLLRRAEWGAPIALTVRRGLDQPYTTHPRLDLFVGATSPHVKGEMGCTICHDGQGSATDFKWASHTPNTPLDAKQWREEHGWFDNHHWIFPMTPDRFIESNCLKCHHEVVELEPSERFPEPPAPKLVEGYQLVRQYGCYGCHEFNGYDGPDKRIGPDLRVEPNYYEVAAQVLRDEGLSDEERDWAETLVHAPDADSVRRQLMRAINRDQDADAEPRLTLVTHALASGLKDVDAPGRLRKVGPSLRHLDSKVDYGWLYNWIRRPADFRPSTRMPQFFGHHEHLKSDRPEMTVVDANGQERKISDAEYTARFEELEIRALAHFLLDRSQPFDMVDPPASITEPVSADRGKWLFESRGCLACHSHQDFPGIQSDQGPDLSRVAAKFASGKGQRWLYSWLKAPNQYHSQTAMPNVYLDPIAEVDASNRPTGKVTDPAADIVAYLLSVPADWQPEVAPPNRELTADEERALEDLAAVWLSASFPRRRAAEYAREGIPDRIADTVKIDEKVLVGMTAANRTERQLEYVARRSMSRYGCFGCHEIPGFETAKPIGTPLANWGRKDTSQLAFENIGTFLATHGVAEDGSDAPHSAHGDDHGYHVDPMSDKYDADTGFFLQSLNSHQRAGFLWQKLRMPRTFDYGTTKVKRYDERLRMPKFPFTPAEREAVMTFVLGLVSEPPAEQYIFNPSPREKAIVEGRHVINKYNCGGCHVLDMERWEVAIEADWFDEPPVMKDYDFLVPDVTEQQLAESLETDRRGWVHADLYGMATRSEETGEPNRVDEDGVPLDPEDNESDPYYEFSLYRHAVVAGATRMVGVQNLLIPAEGDGPAQGAAHPAVGGDLARYLYPRVITEEHRTDPTAKGIEAWSWLPPPLHDEGAKVQTDWLHDFLMDPTAIRPAVVMRMPNFHMTSDEASKLVNYFAAKSNVEFPYEYNRRRRADYLARLEADHPTRLDDAMKIVTDGNYCVKCHSVGDYQVQGAIRTLGPNLADVYHRLRPDYVRRWVGNPQRILPYTGMPVNIPYDAALPHQGGVNQALFPGSSVEQLDGLVDLLMNFDEYARRRTSVKGLVRESPSASRTSADSSPQPDEAPARR